MITRKEIQERLKREIEMSGKSQTEIAKLLEIKPQSVQQYLTGRALPSLETFANLCHLIDIDSEYILGLKK